MTTHKAWLVDLDGTLYHALPVRLAMQLELLRARPRDLRAIVAFRREHERVRREVVAVSPAVAAVGPTRAGAAATGEALEAEAADPFARQLVRTAHRLGIPRAELEPVIHRYMIERPGRWLRLFRRRRLLEEIETFRRAGGRCALVSDYPARAKLAALDAERLFDVVIAVGEPGGPSRLKPDPEGYLSAAAALGVTPAACLVVGDRDDADGAAARAAGMAFRGV